MVRAVRDCLVTGYERLIPTLRLPDADDRHVLAAAVRARAEIIVTGNLRDFPADCLGHWGIEPKGPDEFVLDQVHRYEKLVWGCVQQIADAWRNPRSTVDDVLSGLEPCGLIQSVAVLRGG